MKKGCARRLGGVSFAAVLVSLIPFQPTMAQEAASDNGGLEEIVVSAQKREQSANDVGITLNAFSGDQLSKLGILTAQDVALHTPGLTVNDSAATGVPVYSIRGVGFQDYSTAASSTVGLYFDEVAMPYTVMSRGAAFDLERVEVLKGPQGDLYGRNTTAGQINYISRRPTSSFEGGAKFSVASYETLGFEGFISGPLTEGVNGRLAFTTQQSGKGWQQSISRDDRLGKKNVLAARGLLDIAMGDATLLLRGQYVKDRSDNQTPTAYDGRDIGIGEFSTPYSAILPFLLSGTTPPWYSTGDSKVADWSNSYTDPIWRVYDLRPRRDNDLASFSAKLDLEIAPDISFVSLTGYDFFKRREANDWDGMPSVDTSTINRTRINVFSQELRLAGDMDRLNWVVGGYYSRDTVNENYQIFLADSVFGQGGVDFGIFPFVLAPLSMVETRYRQLTTSKAGFAHVEYELLDGLRLTVGGRYTDEKRSFVACSYDNGDGTVSALNNLSWGASLAPGACNSLDDLPGSPTNIFNLIGTPAVNDAFHPYDETIRAKKWMYRFGVDYKITPRILVYASASRGFKSGGFNGAAANTLSQVGPYRPEELNAYEVGVKSTLFDRALQLNVSGFYYDYRDKQEAQVAVTPVGNISGLTNVPKSRIYGVDVEATAKPMQGLLLNFGLEYLNSKVTEWLAVSDQSVYPNVVLVDASGQSLAQSPKWQLNGGAEYGFEVGRDMKLTAGFDVSYKSATSGGVYPQNATEAYTVANVRLALSDISGNATLSLWCRNLFNEYYYPAAYRATGPYVRLAGQPRTVGATAEFAF